MDYFNDKCTDSLEYEIIENVCNSVNTIFNKIYKFKTNSIVIRKIYKSTKI